MKAIPLLLGALLAAAPAAASVRVPAYAQDLAPHGTYGSSGPYVPAWARRASSAEAADYFDGTPERAEKTFAVKGFVLEPGALAVPETGARRSFAALSPAAPGRAYRRTLPEPVFVEHAPRTADKTAAKDGALSAALSGGFFGLLAYLVNPLIGIGMIVGSVGAAYAD
ncbi:MAG: hypothetical protein ABIJ96_06800 [Elusimicrobiota bacterium]